MNVTSQNKTKLDNYQSLILLGAVILVMIMIGVVLYGWYLTLGSALQNSTVNPIPQMETVDPVQADATIPAGYNEYIVNDTTTDESTTEEESPTELTDQPVLIDEVEEGSALNDLETGGGTTNVQTEDNTLEVTDESEDGPVVELTDQPIIIEEPSLEI